MSTLVFALLLMGQVRDMPARPVVTGNALISGVVVNDEASPKPLRHARVTLSGDEKTTVVTDDNGRFVLPGLPAGRYSLSASKPGYIAINYGARRADRPGTAVVLAAGEQKTDIVIRVPRGAVITGTIYEPAGERAGDALVRIFRYVTLPTGDRRLVPFNTVNANDRGEYRVFGLVAGEYIVGTSRQLGQQFLQTRKEDVESAVRDLKIASGTPLVKFELAASSPGVTYSTTYFPGTVNLSDATTVTVSAGEERAGTDIALQLVPTASIRGVVLDPSGRRTERVMVSMTQSSSMPAVMLTATTTAAQPDGTFVLGPVGAGSYSVFAQVMAPKTPGRDGALFAPQTLAARADVVVDGRDVQGLTLTLQPGATVSGRLVFDGGTPADTTRLVVGVMPLVPASLFSETTSTPDANGNFAVTGLQPGRHRVTWTVPEGPAWSSWALKSATLNGKDVLADGVDVGTENLSNLIVTSTNRTAELSGVIQDASGRAVTDYAVVVFAADKSLWSTPARRARVVRPDSTGRWVVPGLLPGEYLVAAASEAEPGDLIDPSFLERLAAASAPVTLVESDRKPLNLRIGG
jgi:hypothetical protein